MGEAVSDEQPGYWAGHSHADLVQRCAALHAQRRQLVEQQAIIEIHAVRRTVADIFITGKGVEVGAGARPFPIPAHAECYYGDVLDADALARYFGTSDVRLSGAIDARTMEGVPEDSLDFVISAHVIEHLPDPLGAIEAAIRRLKPGGVLLLVVPEMQKTWDRTRPPTTLSHAIADYADGGEGTRLQAYIEHTRYVHTVLTGVTVPEDEVEPASRRIMAAGMDIHVHAWRAQDFRELLDYAAPRFGFAVAHQLESINEALFVLRRSAGVDR